MLLKLIEKCGCLKVLDWKEHRWLYSCTDLRHGDFFACHLEQEGSSLPASFHVLQTTHEPKSLFGSGLEC